MTFHKFLVNAIVFKKLFSLSLAVHYFYITIRTFLYKNLRLKNAQNSRTCLKQTRGWGKGKNSYVDTMQNHGNIILFLC